MYLSAMIDLHVLKCYDRSART